MHRTFKQVSEVGDNHSMVKKYENKTKQRLDTIHEFSEKCFITIVKPENYSLVDLKYAIRYDIGGGYLPLVNSFIIIARWLGPNPVFI